MADPREERVAPARPLGREEIERRLRDTLDELLGGRTADETCRLVPISPAELVRLAAPMTSRN
jgi:hypothetical protein